MMKKRIGIISYNIYCNYTNYGSALQSYALFNAIKMVSNNVEPILVDYCPDVLKDKNPLNPLKNTWDQDDTTKNALILSSNDIEINFKKYEDFFRQRFVITKEKYTRDNFNTIKRIDEISNFVCGSDTIFCTLEFHGFDDGYFANYSIMKKGYCFSYAASFGDSKFDTVEEYTRLKELLANFKLIGVREATLVDKLAYEGFPIKRVIDPTLLLERKDYDEIASDRLVEGDYLVLYARRHNDEMVAYAEKIAKKYRLKIIDISLRAYFYKDHKPYYSAGVEEFLSLIKYSKYVITNSYHGLIFGLQYEKPLAVFSREQADTKIGNLLSLLDCEYVFHCNNDENYFTPNYNEVNKRIKAARGDSFEFLKKALEGCE